jgi:hypothetical protein
MFNTEETKTSFFEAVNSVEKSLDLLKPIRIEVLSKKVTSV